VTLFIGLISSMLGKTKSKTVAKAA